MIKDLHKVIDNLKLKSINNFEKAILKTMNINQSIMFLHKKGKELENLTIYGEQLYGSSEHDDLILNYRELNDLFILVQYEQDILFHGHAILTASAFTVNEKDIYNEPMLYSSQGKANTLNCKTYYLERYLKTFEL